MPPNSLNTDLVVASFRNVTNPTICMVPGLVIDSQKANMNSTGCKHRYLKFHIDRWSAPRLGTHRWHEVNFCANVTLGLTGKTLDAPDNGLLLGFVLRAPKIVLDLGLGSILWHGNLYHHMSGVQLIREIGNNLQIDGNPVNNQICK